MSFWSRLVIFIIVMGSMFYYINVILLLFFLISIKDKLELFYTIFTILKNTRVAT